MRVGFCRRIGLSLDRLGASTCGVLVGDVQSAFGSGFDNGFDKAGACPKVVKVAADHRGIRSLSIDLRLVPSF
jgi:hypothetical protein